MISLILKKKITALEMYYKKHLLQKALAMVIPFLSFKGITNAYLP